MGQSGNGSHSHHSYEVCKKYARCRVTSRAADVADNVVILELDDYSSSEIAVNP
jgi:hypothetical protein